MCLNFPSFTSGHLNEVKLFNNLAIILIKHLRFKMNFNSLSHLPIIYKENLEGNQKKCPKDSKNNKAENKKYRLRC